MGEAPGPLWGPRASVLPSPCLGRGGVPSSDTVPGRPVHTRCLLHPRLCTFGDWGVAPRTSSLRQPLSDVAPPVADPGRHLPFLALGQQELPSLTETPRGWDLKGLSLPRAWHQTKHSTHHLTLKFTLQDGGCHLQVLVEETSSETSGNFPKVTQPGRDGAKVCNQVCQSKAHLIVHQQLPRWGLLDLQRAVQGEAGQWGEAGPGEEPEIPSRSQVPLPSDFCREKTGVLWPWQWSDGVGRAARMPLTPTPLHGDGTRDPPHPQIQSWQRAARQWARQDLPRTGGGRLRPTPTVRGLPPAA